MFINTSSIIPVICHNYLQNSNRRDECISSSNTSKKIINSRYKKINSKKDYTINTLRDAIDFNTRSGIRL